MLTSYKNFSTRQGRNDEHQLIKLIFIKARYTLAMHSDYLRLIISFARNQYEMIISKNVLV